MDTNNPGVMVGPAAGMNLGIGRDSIQARINGAEGTLYLNDRGGNTRLNRNGGNVWIGDGTRPTSTLIVDSDTTPRAGLPLTSITIDGFSFPVTTGAVYGTELIYVDGTCERGAMAVLRPPGSAADGLCVCMSAFGVTGSTDPVWQCMGNFSAAPVFNGSTQTGAF